MESTLRLFPPTASWHAGQVDLLLMYLLCVSGFFIILIAGAIVYFAWKYRRKSDSVPARPQGSHIGLEVAWTAIPLLLTLVMFVWGAKLYANIYSPPPDAMPIYVIGKQWMWKIQHPEGRREINALHVPVNRPIRLVMQSQDVIHDFFIPAFRIKHDVLPGRIVQESFIATKTGEYWFFCTQYCGTEHAKMIGKVIVMEPQAYQAWLAGTDPNEAPAKAGEKLFTELGCTQCHGQVAPNLGGLYGSKVELNNGKTVKADDEYIRESILDSTAKIVKGYPPIMPSFRGQLSEEQVMQLLEYIKSLKNPEEHRDIKKP